MQKKQKTPQEIFEELNKYIIGQEEAKKAVAIALRNRWRRQHADPEICDEITPSNILMKGPTGTGKTEIGRRIAKLSKVPFVKVEASRYTEVGYVGESVTTILELLVAESQKIVKKEKQEALKKDIKEAVNQIILDIMVPPLEDQESNATNEDIDLNKDTRAVFLSRIAKGDFDERIIEVKIKETHNSLGVISGNVMDEGMMISFQNILNRLVPGKTKATRMTVKEAKKILAEQEAEKRIDPQSLREETRKRAETGIIFIDEIDKITAGYSGQKQGPDVSREGVQRNLLPIVEGTTVNTRMGPIKTDHILFIAAGAFHNSKPSDLMPEFQGRFPARVELGSLTEEDYYQILQKPKNALLKQERAILASEDIKLEFTSGAIRAMSKAAYKLNTEKENIGARRLRTVSWQVLKEIYYDAPDKIVPGSSLSIDQKFVDRRLAPLFKDEMSSDYIL